MRGQYVRHCAHSLRARLPTTAIFHDELVELESVQPSYRLHLQLTGVGQIRLRRLADIVPDWRDRPAWVCGPPAMLDTAEESGRTQVRGRSAHRAVHHRRYGQRRRRRHCHLCHLRQEHRNRRRDLSFRGRRESSASRCRSVAGWASARPAYFRWNQAMCATSDLGLNTAKANASKRASPPPPATAPSTSEGDSWLSPISRNMPT